MAKTILALITEIDPTLRPTHPIVLPPDVPPGIWPNPPEGTAPIPEHPIVIPPDAVPVPPGIWPNPPEGTAPMPEHPIVIPPIPPDGPPAVIWPNPPEGTAPMPEHPIVIPPGEELPKNFIVIVYDPGSGEWKKISFVPGGKPPTTPGPKR